VPLPSSVREKSAGRCEVTDGIEQRRAAFPQAMD
jgi:hypothetical protein